MQKLSGKLSVTYALILQHQLQREVLELVAVIDFFFAVICCVELDAILVAICVLPFPVFLGEVFSVRGSVFFPWVVSSAEVAESDPNFLSIRSKGWLQAAEFCTWRLG